MLRPDVPVPPERWEAAMALLDAALERPAAERLAFVAAAAGADAALRDEVASLLAEEPGAADFLEAPAPLPTLGSGGAPGAAVAGRRVGPYRLVREIGRGGMGTVYLAERDDVGRTVALKLVRGGLAAPERAERFLVERRVLARLDHPFVARLLDAGVVDDGGPDAGTPWFAMEYVDGEPLDRYCDARRLPVDARLALFQQVCEAVAYAHRSLVVHRDLKPSNVLVTAGGTVKLLDFGIAKLLGADDAPHTQTEGRSMTPEYAAPEQVRGDPVTTATDVYGLGVLLYELLAGRRPYRLRGRSLAEVERVVLHSDPPRPSAAVLRAEPADGADGPGGVAERHPPADVAAARRLTPERLARRLAGDLDTIVGKALDKIPERRYPSAEQFGADVGRHLTGHPVLARADRWSYRTRKFVRRHRVAVAGAAALVLVASGAGGAVLRERNRARLAARKAERVSALLGEIFLAGTPRQAQGRTVTARDLLDRGAARLATLRNEPDVQASLATTIGEAYNVLGAYDRARPLLEAALATRRRLHPGDHAEVAASLWALGSLLSEQNDFRGAERAHRESLAMRRRLFPAGDSTVVYSLNALAFAVRVQGRARESEQLYRAALALRPALEARGAMPAVPTERANIWAFVLNGLGAALAQQGRYAEAEPVLRQGIALARTTVGERSPELYIQLGNLGDVLAKRGKLEEASAVSRQAVDGARRVFGDAHPAVAFLLTVRGGVLRQTGALREAEAALREALSINRRALPARAPRTATTLVELGTVLTTAGRAAAAEPLLREAVAIREGDVHPAAVPVAVAHGALGDCLTALGRYAEAEPLVRGSYQALRGALPASDPAVRAARERVVRLEDARR